MVHTSKARRLRTLIAARERKRGLLIAFEGPDGSGKTTQRKLLARWLESQNQDVVSTTWASSPLVRPLLKVRKKIRTLSTEEYSLLHAVDFRHRVETSILPALWSGKTVLADRYLFTALARDAARGLDLDWLLHAYAPLLWPDLVIYFSMTPEDSRRRLASTRSPRFYQAGQDVTGIEDPLASYGQFVDRVVKEYNNLSVVEKREQPVLRVVLAKQDQPVRQEVLARLDQLEKQDLLARLGILVLRGKLDLLVRLDLRDKPELLDRLEQLVKQDLLDKPEQRDRREVPDKQVAPDRQVLLEKLERPEKRAPPVLQGQQDQQDKPERLAKLEPLALKETLQVISYIKQIL